MPQRAELGHLTRRGVLKVACYLPRSVHDAWEGKFMLQSMVRLGSAAGVALGIALAGASAANAESIMKECGPSGRPPRRPGQRTARPGRSS